MRQQKRKTKILVLTTSLPRNKTDWWAQFVLNIYRNINKKKFDITIITPHAPHSKLHETLFSIKIIRFPYFYPFSLEKLTTGEGILHSYKRSVLARLQLPLLLLSESAIAFKELITHRYDAIHAHWVLPQGFMGVVFSYMFRIPLIITVHGSDVFGLRKFNFLKKIAFERAELCTVNSSATLKAVVKIAPRAKIKLIPMGVNVKLFANRKKKTGLKSKLGANPLLLCVGRLIQCKGFEYAIRAVSVANKRLRDIKLIIVGVGSEFKRLQHLAQRMNISDRVIFLGNRNHKQLSAIYNSVDIYLSPSVSDTKTGEIEGQNLTILEALASGLPVIASNSGGIVDMIDGEKTGILTKEKDYKEIATKIIYLANNTSVRGKFLRNSQNLIKNKYSWSKVGKSFEEVYENIV